jgi:hypothetical protein
MEGIVLAHGLSEAEQALVEFVRGNSQILGAAHVQGTVLHRVVVTPNF